MFNSSYRASDSVSSIALLFSLLVFAILFCGISYQVWQKFIVISTRRTIKLHLFFILGKDNAFFYMILDCFLPKLVLASINLGHFTSRNQSIYINDAEIAAMLINNTYFLFLHPFYFLIYPLGERNQGLCFFL